MSDMFNVIMQFILEHEGGYVDDPQDPGGETNYGISKRDHPDVDIKNLTKLQAMDIYFKEYWSPAWERQGFPIAACMFDTNVNMGLKTANYFLQQCDSSYIQYLQLRLARYADLAKNPNLKKYQNGWNTRVTDLRRFIEINKDNPNVHSNW